MDRNFKSIIEHQKKMKEYLFRIKDNLDSTRLNFPVTDISDKIFPEYVSIILDDYTDYYRKNLHSHISALPSLENDKNKVFPIILKLVENLKEVITLYYEGNVYKATTLFNQTLDNIISFDFVRTTTTFEKGKSFFRARVSEDKLVKKDLFHVNFENRHFVSTNRYSIPGLPALYLADSTYTCWEEFNRPKLRNVWFSRFENTDTINLIQLQRLDDFLLTLEEFEPVQIVKIISYLILHPLTLLCSVRVKYPQANFKPEYIIPQMLLQYVSQENDIDGIMFPSTKVDYTKLHGGLLSYNYIFPVKKIRTTGYCSILVNKFDFTEPTSLEIEELMYNPSKPRMVHGYIPDSEEKIELITNIKSAYNHTSFGKIEKSLSNLTASKLFY